MFSKVSELQEALVRAQNDQVSLQLEQKDLRKKQRRSDKYYSNKETRGSESGNGDTIEDGSHGEDGVSTTEDGKILHKWLFCLFFFLLFCLPSKISEYHLYSFLLIYLVSYNYYVFFRCHFY